MTERNCIDHRKNLLHFLAVKTAPVRCGVKPGALLRVPFCSGVADAGGERERQNNRCAELENILKLLSLEHKALGTGASGELILFYDRAALEATLRKKRNARFLAGHGYDPATGADECLETLRMKFADPRMARQMPHEIGVFLGYPLKDVAGFIAAKEMARAMKSRALAIRGDWKVFGAAEESLRLMNLYRLAEALASRIVETHRDFGLCLEKIASLKPTTQIMESANA